MSRLGGAPRTRSHLSASAAEEWCLESMVISASGLTPDGLFWLRFEMRPADARELSSVVGEPGISITRLIEIFSRRAHGEQTRWVAEAGPVRLAELRKAALGARP